MSKPSPLGPRVIGEKAYAEAQEVERTKSNIYGPRVIGEDAEDGESPAPAGPAASEVAEQPTTVDREPAEPQPTDTADEAKDAAGNEPGSAFHEKANPEEDQLGRPEVGPRVQPPASPNPFEAAGDGDGSGYVNLKELNQVLSERPELLDAAVEFEFKDGEPRKGALRLFVELEEARPEGARPDRLELYQTHLDD